MSANSNFVFKRIYKGQVSAVILDWSGTTADAYVIALAYPRPVRLPIAVKLALLALLAAIAAFAPRPARADEGQIASDFKRGPYAEFAWRPALAPLRTDVMPAARTHFMIGARLARSFVLGTMGHVTLYFDRGQKAGVGLDVIGQIYVVKGLYLRGGAGVISHVPLARDVLTNKIEAPREIKRRIREWRPDYLRC